MVDNSTQNDDPKTDGSDEPTKTVAPEAEKTDLEKVGEQGFADGQKNAEAEKAEQTEPEEQVTAKVTTSDAQKELKPEGDTEVKTGKAELLKDNKAAQKPDAAVKQGQADAKKNAKADAESQSENTADGTKDPVAQGIATAKKNAKAEKAENSRE